MISWGHRKGCQGRCLQDSWVHVLSDEKGSVGLSFLLYILLGFGVIFFKGPKWNLPDRAGFEDWFVVTLFPLHISFSEYHTYFVVEKQLSAHLLRVKVLHTPSRVAERFPRLGSGRRPVIPSFPRPLRMLTRSDLFPSSPSLSWNVRSVFSNGIWPSQESSPGHLVLETSVCYAPLSCIFIKPLLLLLFHLFSSAF